MWTRYLKNYLSQRLETWSTYCKCWEDELVNFWEKSKNNYDLWPFLINWLVPGFTKTCKQDISKAIWATDLKLGQYIGNDKERNWSTYEKNLTYGSGVLSLFQNLHWTLWELVNKIPQTILARDSKLGQHIGSDKQKNWSTFQKNPKIWLGVTFLVIFALYHNRKRKQNKIGYISTPRWHMGVIMV